MKLMGWRTAVVIGLAVLALSAWGCSKSKAPEQTATKTEPAPAMAEDEAMPAIVRTPWKGDLDEMVKRRAVRVLVPYRRPEYFYMEGHAVGILSEAFQELESVLNAKYKTTAANRVYVVLMPTPMDQLRDRMVNGLGDIAAFGISITEQNKAVADFTIPTMTGLKIIVVTGPGAPELKSLDDLSGKEVWANPLTRMKNDLAALNARLKAKGKVLARMREVDTVLEPGDVMEMVNAGIYPLALMQSQQAAFWGQTFSDAKPRMDLALGEDVELGWAIQKGTPQLKAFLDDFIKTHGVGTSFGSTLLRRYLKDAKYVRNATEKSEMKKFRATAPTFQKYAAEYELDYLLLVAQGYQESRLDQGAKSQVGAVGIMQVMPSTAAGAPVNVPNIEKEANNINAGVRMMHFMIRDNFNEEGVDRLNRELFALAAYNAGPGRLRACRAKAKAMGYDPNKWFGNVEVAVAQAVGRETTQYVANIYKYYLAYQMARGTNLRRESARQKVKNSKATP
jgi:membrane-bound lytic murein transglycosylase MltF